MHAKLNEKAHSLMSHDHQLTDLSFNRMVTSMTMSAVLI